MEKVVLVVEDEQPLLKAITSKLEKSGLSAVSARTKEQAVNLLSDVDHISAIWLDHYLLGKEDGLDLVAEVKQSEKWKTIPIFVVSNTASPEKVRSYMKLGVSKYYIKSNQRLDIIIEELKDILNNTST